MIKEGGGVIHLPTFYIKKFIEDPDLWLSDWSAAKTFLSNKDFRGHHRLDRLPRKLNSNNNFPI